MQWLFTHKAGNELERNPTQGEHFNKRSDDSSSEDIVREGIQNSLDARSKDAKARGLQVKVKISVCAQIDTPSYDDVKHIFDPDFFNHALAKGSGLNNPPSDGDDCPYLVYEDFETTGLVGDVASTESPEQGVKNRFYCFVRADATQDKEAGDMGSWGVGKTVFPSTSRLNTTLFKSVREKDNKISSFYMGRAIFRYHRLNKGEKLWRPDSWFCKPTKGCFGSESSELFAMPIIEDSDPFKPFNLSRDNEPGLSIIVPYIDYEDFTFQKLLKAVIENWAFAIVKNDLAVEISVAGQCEKISSTTISNAVELIEDQAVLKNLKSLVLIAEDHGSVLPPDCCFTLEDQYPYKNEDGRSVSPKWEGLKDDWIDDVLAEKMKTALDEHGLLKVQVPIQIERVKPPVSLVQSFFTVFFKEALDQHGAIRPYPFREGLLVKGRGAGDSPKQVTGYSSVIWIDEGELADMLRDAEDPSHSSWSSRAGKFEGKYKYGKATLNFVRNSAYRIMRSIINEDEINMSIFEDLVGLPAAPKKKKKKRKIDKLKPPPLPPSKFTISKGNGWFKVTPGIEKCEKIASLTIRAVYSNGSRKQSFSTYKRYAKNKIYDFEFGNDINVEHNNCELLSQNPNRMVIQSLGEGFSIECSGFDQDRDVYIDVSPKMKEE